MINEFVRTQPQFDRGEDFFKYIYFATYKIIGSKFWRELLSSLNDFWQLKTGRERDLRLLSPIALTNGAAEVNAGGANGT